MALRKLFLVTTALSATITLNAHASPITEITDWSNDRGSPTDLTSIQLLGGSTTFSGHLNVDENGDEDYISFYAPDNITSIVLTSLTLAEPPKANRIAIELYSGNALTGDLKFTGLYGNSASGSTLYDTVLGEGIYTLYLRETDAGNNPYEISVLMGPEPSSLALSAITVPEPASAALLFLGLGCLLTKTKRLR